MKCVAAAWDWGYIWRSGATNFEQSGMFVFPPRSLLLLGHAPYRPPKV
jgi:hypothetical protein